MWALQMGRTFDIVDSALPIRVHVCLRARFPVLGVQVCHEHLQGLCDQLLTILQGGLRLWEGQAQSEVLG